jgi:N-acetylneuraminate lyase
MIGAKREQQNARRGEAVENVEFELIAATHTPMSGRAELQLDVVDRQAEHLCGMGVRSAFIAGSTGEGQALTVRERLALAGKWMAATVDRPLRVIVHVGHQSQQDAITLARHANEIRAAGIAFHAPISTIAPSIDDLIAFFQPVAAAAGDLPALFYDFPELTRVRVPTAEFLRAARRRMPNLVGVKFTNSDLVELQRCLHLEGESFQVYFGRDEFLLAAIALGVEGAVGSSFNFAAPLYLRMAQAAGQGKMDFARQCQYEAAQLIAIAAKYGYPRSSKAIMRLIGIDCGPPRPPLQPLTDDEFSSLQRELTETGLIERLTHYDPLSNASSSSPGPM